jgi:hypothetical protein
MKKTSFLTVKRLPPNSGPGSRVTTGHPGQAESQISSLFISRVGIKPLPVFEEPPPAYETLEIPEDLK